MSEDVKPSAIKDVQDSLGKYVKKPPLTEKLLKKPPFRYLHDIVSAVIRETGFLSGLYTADELDSNNVKDKESKIAFLNKLIVAVQAASGKNLSARPAKIVAGLEVNKTLALLQAIGQAIEQTNPAQVVTEVVKSSDKELPKPSKSVSNSDAKEKKIKEITPNATTIVPDSKVENAAGTSKNSTAPARKLSSVSDTSEKKRRSSVIEKRDGLKKERLPQNAAEAKPAAKEATSVQSSTDKNKATKEAIASKRPSVQSKSTPVRRPSLKDSNRRVVSSTKNLQSVINEEKEDDARVLTKENTKPEKSKAVEINKTQENTPETLPAKPEAQKETVNSPKANQNRKVSTDAVDATVTKAEEIPQEGESNEKSPPKKKESMPIQRPGSARPGSRKLSHSNSFTKDTTETVSMNEGSDKTAEDPKSTMAPSIRPRTATRPPSARPGAPRIRDRGEVLVADEAVVASNPVNVIEEGKQDQFADDKDSFILIESQPPALPVEESTQINDADQGQLVHQILKTQKELNESMASDMAQNKHLEIEWEAGRQREKDVVSKEIEKIRSSIQTLTSAANPLGKLFDFLQEDVDEMQRELQHWKNINEKLQRQQRAEAELGKASLQPLQKQLLDVENSIHDEYMLIAVTKSTILANDDRILKLATGTGSGPNKTRVK